MLVSQTDWRDFRAVCFEDNMRAGCRHACGRGLVFRVPSQSVLGGFRNRGDGIQHPGRNHPIHGIRKERRHRFSHSVPRKPLWIAHAGGVAGGMLAAASVCDTG